LRDACTAKPNTLPDHPSWLGRARFHPPQIKIPEARV
jgi:hypothetical protein